MYRLCIGIALLAHLSGASVIIVGAGAAGIAAATRLLQNGINNITILEAENRIGGRVHSIEFGDAIVDLGAQWCHGQKGNIVYDMVKDLNLLGSSNYTIAKPRIFHSSRKTIDQKLINKMLAAFDELDDAKNIPDDIVKAQFITSGFNEAFSKMNLNEEDQQIVNEAVDVLEHLSLSLDGSFSWDDVAATSDFVDCEGDPDMNWKGRGYKTVLDVLMKKFPDPSKKLPIDDKIYLNKEVAKIDWNQMAVSCSDGSIYQADYIIFTPSLGVLKAQHETLFRPELPPEKRIAINQKGIGAAMKIVLHFPTKWWPEENFPPTFLMWSEADKAQIRPANNSWFLGISQIFPTENNPNVFTMWVTGKSVPYAETIPDQILIDGCVQVLENFFGNVSKPDQMVRSNWFSNPHFRGTYSYQTVQSLAGKVSAESTLSRPILLDNGKGLFFAGETTNRIHFATVHGAIETGFREADNIIKVTKMVKKISVQ